MITGTSALYIIVKKKLWAQAMCVRATWLLQSDLKKDLESLLRLNPRARRLAQSRQKADRALRLAMQSGNPLAIKVAAAAVLALTAEQLALQNKQSHILTMASGRRERARIDLSRSVQNQGVQSVQSRTFFALPLAVAPLPPGAVAPEYIPVAGFSFAQQQLFQFQVELAPEFLRHSYKQSTSCSTSLILKEGKWREQVIAASL